MSGSYPSSFVMSLDRILRSFSHPSRSLPSNNRFFAGDACDSQRAHKTSQSLRPTLQRLCLFAFDAQLREYRTQNTCPFSDLRTLHRNIVLPRSSHDCSGCDKMMPFGQNWPLEALIGLSMVPRRVVVATCEESVGRRNAETRVDAS